MTTPECRYLRVESARADAEGRHTGIFGLLRDLRRSGRLGPDDADRASALVSHAYELHAEPPSDVYTGGALSWFLSDAWSAAGLEALCGDMAEMLGRYGVETRTVRTDSPGVIAYTDGVQVVAVPHGIR